ncbi:MAG: tetratricopeptide repeat protein, partial [Leptolyngbyaceae cyanobacterium SM2_5_2]|nr:tetratricopeptide repeat protein [Leptolyngbyaceae cyanobacterium SM2_5_2]
AAANGPLPPSSSLGSSVSSPAQPQSQRRLPIIATVAGVGLALLALGFFALQMPKRLATARLTQQAEDAEQAGQIQDAIGYLDQVIQRQPGDSETLAQRSELLLKNGQQEQALNDLTRAIQTDSTSPILHFQRGNLRSDLGDLQGAIDDYTTALELDQGYSEAYLNRGSARADLGDEAGAVDDYTTALEVTDDPEKWRSPISIAAFPYPTWRTIPPLWETVLRRSIYGLVTATPTATGG